MRLPRFGSWLLLRRLVRALDGIERALTAQTVLLARIADAIAPVDPQTDPDQVATQTGVDYLDPLDRALADGYIDRMRAEIGRPPTDDEILSFLADEQTLDLHARLLARDQAAERIARERRR